MNKILKIGAKWCKGCKDLTNAEKPYLKDAISYDVDIDKEVLKEYKISKLPTVIVIENDVEVARLIGMTEVEEYFEK